MNVISVHTPERTMHIFTLQWQLEFVVGVLNDLVEIFIFDF